MMPRVLVGCETSGVVREALWLMGCEAWSCDLLPAERPTVHHLQMDIFRAVTGFGPWDLIICHPECTKLCVSGNHVYAAGKPKHHERLAAVAWTERLWDACLAHAPRVAFENPQGVLATLGRLPKAQFVQPYEFGDDASKRTGLHLHNLPPLVKDPARRVAGRVVEWPKGSGRFVERWANQTDSGQNRLPPSAGRWKERSRTYDGIGAALAVQWGLALAAGDLSAA